MPCVPWAQIEDTMGKREYNRFSKWMAIQLTYQRVFTLDLEDYLTGATLLIN
jgi:hypothetical protein